MHPAISKIKEHISTFFLSTCFACVLPLQNTSLSQKLAQKVSFVLRYYKIHDVYITLNQKCYNATIPNQLQTL
jgi:hypothetical protein